MKHSEQGLVVASDLKDYFEQKKPKCLTVHSVFDDAINLLDDDDRLISLVNAGKAIAPMSLIVPFHHKFIRSLTRGDGVCVDAMHLKALRSSHELDLKPARVWEVTWSLTSSILEREVLLDRLRLLKEAIMAYGDLSGLLRLITAIDATFGQDQRYQTPLNTYCEFIQGVFTKLCTALEAQAFDEVLAYLPKFIGFGPGLTPSTDDFLCGVMVVLFAASAQNEPQKLLTDQWMGHVYQLAKNQTTKVSESMYHHASQGKFPDSYRRLVEGLLFDQDADLDALTQSVVAHGATSGSDVLLGIYTMAWLKYNPKKKEA